VAIAAVTLDAVGTLIAVAEPVGETYARVAARHGLRVGAEEAGLRFRAAFAAAPPLAFPGAGRGLRDHERAWWHAIVSAAIGPAAAAGSVDAALDELFTHYAGAGAWRVFPEVAGVLGTLRARGLRLAVASNFDGRLVPLLDALGLGRLLDAAAYSSEAGSAKPDPGIFRAALARVGVAPADALHVGDGLVEDVFGARAAGMRALLVDREGREPILPAGVRAVASLDALPRLLDGL